MEYAEVVMFVREAFHFRTGSAVIRSGGLKEVEKKLER
jgi:hypothetical protein